MRGSSAAVERAPPATLAGLLARRAMFGALCHPCAAGVRRGGNNAKHARRGTR